MNIHDLSPSLREKSADEQSCLAQAIITACREGRFLLTAAEIRSLSEFVVQLYHLRSVDDALLMAVSAICRQYEQHLIARAQRMR